MSQSQFLANKVSELLPYPKSTISKVIDLLDNGSTIPFIARYRKEVTGGLDEVALVEIKTSYNKLQELLQRKETIIKSIAEQNKLTPEIEKKISDCWESSVLEDIYLPFKPKRKTRAEIARKKGLEGLAKIIMSQGSRDPYDAAEKFVRGEVHNVDEALAGAQDIIAEWVNENALARKRVRNLFSKYASITSKLVKKKESEAQNYKDYFDFSAALNKCPSHRLLAIRRAEKEGYLRVSIDVDKEHALNSLERIFLKSNNESADIVAAAIADAYKRLLHPSIETEFKNSSKEKADKEAITVFSNNLQQLLMAAPAGNKITLGIDPGFRTGCKVVVLSAQGELLHHTTIYPHPPQNQWAESLEIIQKIVQQYKVELIGVGNGTAGRETMSLAESAVKEKAGIEVYSVNESGASIYSASKVAREEFKDLDLTVRGTISIARRLMDPLAELVKIDPKSIGVGQYQHDVNQDMLKNSLSDVVSFAVNQVGVNLNTASHHLLAYVSGIGPKLAQNIIAHRKNITSFSQRKQLNDVKGLGNKAYQQAAGFLRIPDAKEILDRTAVHPESYKTVQNMAKSIGKPLDSLVGADEILDQINLNDYVTEKVGLPTLQDIIKELKKPGLDPRGKAEVFHFDNRIHKIDDLYTGMVIPGIISNITKFGAFVDIGIKENGLIHISQIVDRFISDPAEVLKLDQKVTVKVLDIDKARKRISLSMKAV